MAATAIERVLTGERAWNENADPFKYLCSIVDSLVSHLVDGWENRHQRTMPTTCQDDGTERPIELPGSEPEPVQVVADEEETAAYREAVRKALAGDRLAEGIFECLSGGFSTPADMAELLNVEIGLIYTAKARLGRAVNTVLGKSQKPSRSDKGARHARNS